MSIQLKLLPTLIMLVAGAFTSIVTYVLHYDGRKAVWILVGVLVLFYILGVVVQKVVYKFESEIEAEEARKAAEEGVVLEKDAGGESEGVVSEQTDEQPDDETDETEG